MRLILSETYKITNFLKMKYFKNNLLLVLLIVTLISSCTPTQNIQVSKSSSNESGPQTLIYSLPKTRVDINIQVTKTITKSGPYAAYAEKYLTLTKVPTFDSEVFEITEVKIIPVNEPDPDQYYALNFKMYPSNLDKLFSLTEQGLMLNLENSWKTVSNEFPSKHQGSGINFERSIYEPNITTDTDTLYKTILTDASFVKVPIYKKSIEIKKEEDKAEDMANLILKLRKRRIKLIMGDYDYHPDGLALKTIIAELRIQEDELMSHFIGKKIRETNNYSFSFTPNTPVSKEILWFSEDKGVSETSKTGMNAISASIMMKETASINTEFKTTEKITNSIYFRSPIISQVNVKIGNIVLAESRIPIYQAGKIQLFPILP